MCGRLPTSTRLHSRRGRTPGDGRVRSHARRAVTGWLTAADKRFTGLTTHVAQTNLEHPLHGAAPSHQRQPSCWSLPTLWGQEAVTPDDARQWWQSQRHFDVVDEQWHASSCCTCAGMFRLTSFAHLVPEAFYHAGQDLVFWAGAQEEKESTGVWCAGLMRTCSAQTTPRRTGADRRRWFSQPCNMLVKENHRPRNDSGCHSAE